MEQNTEIGGGKTYQAVPFVILAAVLGLVVGYFIGKQANTITTASAPTTTSSQTVVTMPDTSTWKTCSNPAISATLKYPTTGWACGYDAGNSELTLTSTSSSVGTITVRKNLWGQQESLNNGPSSTATIKVSAFADLISWTKGTALASTDAGSTFTYSVVEPNTAQAIKITGKDPDGNPILGYYFAGTKGYYDAESDSPTSRSDALVLAILNTFAETK